MVGQLGDGRGLLIAQILNKKKTIDLHLKVHTLRPIHVWEMGEQFYALLFVNI